jgi:hypothetical protein
MSRCESLNYLDNQRKNWIQKIETAAEKWVHVFVTWPAMWEEDAYTCSYIKAPGGEINIKPMSCE